MFSHHILKSNFNYTSLNFYSKSASLQMECNRLFLTWEWNLNSPKMVDPSETTPWGNSRQKKTQICFSNFCGNSKVSNELQNHAYLWGTSLRISVLIIPSLWHAVANLSSKMYAFGTSKQISVMLSKIRLKPWNKTVGCISSAQKHPLHQFILISKMYFLLSFFFSSAPVCSFFFFQY